MPDAKEPDEKPEEEGETLLNVGGGDDTSGEDDSGSADDDAGDDGDPPGETLLEIGQMSIYNDSEIQKTLLEVPLGEATTASPSQAETRLVQASHGGIGGRRYEVKGEIGRGGMGVVMRAFDRDLHREVALKITRHDRTGSHSIGRFVEEAQITGQLAHPNIVPVHELGHETGGRTFFTMKLVEGRSLAQIIRALRAGDAKTRDEFPLSRRIYIFGQLLHCMNYAHDRGVIHRDLKPDNVMIGDYGEVMVMDWGLAKVRDRPELVHKITTTRLQTPGSQTMDGQVIGTPAYMPPEQARGDRDSIDERSDIYSLGAILYELLALRPPYEAQTASELIRRVATEPPPPPSERNPGAIIPTGLERITMKCLAAEQDDRYQKVRELQDALENYEEEVEQSASESLFFSLVGKLFAFLLVSSVFLGTAVILVGAENLYFRTHLIDPGIYSAFMVLSFGTLLEFLYLKPWAAFDATHGIVLWRRAGITSETLRGYFVAEACRRSKWVYMGPVDAALIYAIALQSDYAAIVAIQMFGGALLAILAVGALEQGALRKLDALDAISGQDRRDMLFRWMIVVVVIALAAYFINKSGWEWKLQRMPDDFRRGTLILHLVAILGGVWVIAQIGHPFHEVNRTLRLLLTKKLSKEQRDYVAPMARAFANNAVLFGAIGALTWIGLLAPGGDSVPAAYYLMALTPLWGGIIWSWFFRIRAGKLIAEPSDELVRRYNEYRKNPKTPKKGRVAYALAWAPFIIGGIISAVILIARAI